MVAWQRGALAALVLVSGCAKKDAPSEAAPVDSAAAVSPSAEPMAAPEATGEEPASAIEGASAALAERGPVAAARPHSPPVANQRIDIPAGSYPAGSTPGDVGRDPAVEPALAPMELGAYSIDALPYPGDGSTPRTGVGPREADALCKERGGRLCNEWEWERACRGPELDTYASGAVWDAECVREPSSCASGYGVRGMGAMREWTVGALRGAVPLPATWKADDAERRCARRVPRVDGEGGGQSATFRCCYGEANAPKMPEIVEYTNFRKLKMEDAELVALVGQFPELSRLGSELRFFEPAEVGRVVGRSEKPRDGLSFTTQPLIWSPERGVEILVLTGRGKSASFVLAFHVLPEGKYRLASSLLLLRDVAPLAVVYRASARREVLWSGSWGSSTDEGFISWRDDKRVVIVQK